MASAEPLIFSVQHFCLHDGPGVRSIVFFKGCPLRCGWCQNVESWKARAEIAFKAHLCINCGTCAAKCPAKAITTAGKRDARLCKGCFTCTDNCPSGALTRFGFSKSVDEIASELRPEFSLFASSGGGVTFSGGEPTLFPEFTACLAEKLRAEGIDVVLETCGHFNREQTKPLLRQLRTILFDIKLCDEESHMLLCGSGNTVIKDNLHALAADHAEAGGALVWPRLPFIPGVTDTVENLRGWAEFLAARNISYLTVVPYHPMGNNKRLWLGLPAAQDFRVPSAAELGAAEQLFSAYGIRVYRPGEEPWQEYCRKSEKSALGPATY
ncbi:MAG: glycyl-radical enzyme activating protein [Smithellaceae bacterium]|nr:glycyl-radical enzyme activating protein [Smithellaceae bacterium]